jgi:hypothetical protein
MVVSEAFMYRLLPSIVFASTSLLAGCSGENDLSPNEPSIDAGPDLRACEGGWPTTKGALCEFDAGIVCCTRDDWSSDAGWECCAK